MTPDVEKVAVRAFAAAIMAYLDWPEQESSFRGGAAQERDSRDRFPRERLVGGRWQLQ